MIFIILSRSKSINLIPSNITAFQNQIQEYLKNTKIHKQGKINDIQHTIKDF